MTMPPPEVDALLRALLSGAQAILGSRLVGFYLDGSLAIGDFDPRSSDIDFVVVITEEMPDDVFRALRALHERLAQEPSRWGRELEGSYITRAALGGRDPWPAARVMTSSHLDPGRTHSTAAPASTRPPIGTPRARSRPVS